MYKEIFSGCWEQLVPSMVAVGVAGLSDMDAPWHFALTESVAPFTPIAHHLTIISANDFDVFCDDFFRVHVGVFDRHVDDYMLVSTIWRIKLFLYPTQAVYNLPSSTSMAATFA